MTAEKLLQRTKSMGSSASSFGAGLKYLGLDRGEPTASTQRLEHIAICGARVFHKVYAEQVVGPSG